MLMLAKPFVIELYGVFALAAHKNLKKERMSEALQ
jgi:hypothetical protein